MKSLKVTCSRCGAPTPYKGIGEFKCEYCGTHSKGTPHGTIDNEDSDVQHNQSVQVFAEEIKGIVYYLDKYYNVYNTEDIMKQIENPRIIAKWEKNSNGHYTIPNLGLV